MRITVPSSKRRIAIKDDVRRDIQKYDSDNKYPQNLMIIVSNSGTARGCINLYSKFIKGAGFTKGGDRIVNKRGENLNKVMGFASEDFAFFGGFALHFNYNLNYQISTITQIPFEFCRLGIPDDYNQIAKIAVHKDWAGWTQTIHSSGPKLGEIDYIDVFNPSPKVIEAQVKKAGGWRNYKGQILYFSRSGHLTYPVPAYDSVLEDIESDGRIKTYKYKSIANGFSAFHAFVKKGKFESQEERDEFVEGLNTFQGDENAGSTMLVEVDSDEEAPEIQPFEMQKLDGVFDYTEKSIQDNVRRLFNIPPVLIGDLVVGRLGTAEEILDANILYNAYTSDERTQIEEVFTRIMKLFKRPVRGKLEIEPLTIISEESLIERKSSIPQYEEGTEKRKKETDENE